MNSWLKKFSIKYTSLKSFILLYFFSLLSRLLAFHFSKHKNSSLNIIVVFFLILLQSFYLHQLLYFPSFQLSPIYNLIKSNSNLDGYISRMTCVSNISGEKREREDSQRYQEVGLIPRIDSLPLFSCVRRDYSMIITLYTTFTFSPTVTLSTC